MIESKILGLVHNISLLLALVLVFDFIQAKIHPNKISFPSVFSGFLIGGMGITLMVTPWVLIPGLIFDTRSVLLSVTGLFFGVVPTLIAMAITVAFRIYQGGAGAVMGVSVILSSGAIGILWGKLRKSPLINISWKELYLFGIIIHLVMLACTFTLPLDTALKTLSEISLPVLIIYPIGTMLLGKLMANRLLREQIALNLLESENQLRESESKFRSLFEDSHAVMMIIDPEIGKIIETNTAASEYYGWSPAELCSKNIYEINQLTESEINAEMKNAIDEKRNHFHFRHRLANGEIRQVEVYSGPIQFGDRTLLYSIVHDITERNLIEQALIESEERYHLIDDASQDPIFSYDRQGRFTHANTSLCKSLGLTSEQIVGKTHEELGFPVDECAEWARFRQQVYSTNSPVISEISTPMQGGTPHYFEVVLNPIHNEIGEIIGIAGTMRDIHARKIAEAKIIEQIDELRRWSKLTLGREDRILELKKEVNDLLLKTGQTERYPSADAKNDLQENI